DVAHAALVNVAHREDVNTGFLYDFAFLRVEVARSDDDNIAGFGFGLEAAEIYKFIGAIAHDRGERHAVDVARGRRVRRVHVAVRIEPDVTDFLFVFAKMSTDASANSRRDRMIAAEHKRQKSFAQSLLGRFGNVGAGFGDFLQILGAFFADGHLFRLLYFEVADVFDGMAELLDGRLQSRAAQ